MIEIPNFSLYFFSKDLKITRKSDGKLMPVSVASKNGSVTFKLKDDTGVWRKRTYESLLALAIPPSPPEGFKQVKKYPLLYISREGEVWSSPTKTYPLGTHLKVWTDGVTYPTVTSKKYGTITVHKLLALAYLDDKYLEKGLCVMHLDDDKTNYTLSNLVIGTYSENNQAAYDNGINPGRS